MREKKELKMTSDRARDFRVVGREHKEDRNRGGELCNRIFQVWERGVQPYLGEHA